MIVAVTCTVVFRDNDL